MWRGLVRHWLSLLGAGGGEGDEVGRKLDLGAARKFGDKRAPKPRDLVLLLPLAYGDLGDLATTQLAQLVGDARRAAEQVDEIGFCTGHGIIMGYGFPFVKRENASRDADPRYSDNGKNFPGAVMQQKEKDPYAVECGGRLRRARGAAGFPVRRRFAEYTRVDENNIQKWENGEALVPAAFVKQLRPLGITHDWIFAGDASGMPQRLHAKLLSEDDRERED